MFLKTLSIFLVGLKIGLVNGSCEQACETLYQALPTIYVPGSEPVLPLWSEFQAKVQPLCRLEPEHSSHVAEALAVIRQHQCHFAVLYGELSQSAIAPSDDRGITISLRRMPEVTLRSDAASEVEVPGGSVWGDVYRVLDPRNMSVAGTMNGFTSVVDSILGGGMSFSSEHHGWACVTKAVIKAFHDPPIWHTFQRFCFADKDIVFARLENHTSTMPEHVWQITTTLQWFPPNKDFVISERMVASHKPDLPKSVFRVLQNGKREESFTLQTNAYQDSMLKLSQKTGNMNTGGLSSFSGSVTVRSNKEVSMALAHIFEEEVNLIKDESNLQAFLVYNPLTRNALRHMKRRGGNALRLEEKDGPLTIITIRLHWSKAESEPRMRVLMRSLITRLTQKAESMGMLHPYIYQNHAFEEQDVFAGVGSDAIARLKRIRRNVDPGDIFRKLQSGFFKLQEDSLGLDVGKSEL